MPSLIFTRAFSASPSTPAASSIKRLAYLHRHVPEYPYGVRHWYKQSNFGLYGGAHIQFGNNISADFELKTRRRWRPNVQAKKLWSDSLQRWIRTRVTAKALRTVDKVGGLDEYLLGEKPARIKELGMGGWLLRWRIMQTDAIKERFARQRRELGLPDVDVVETVGGGGREAEERKRTLQEVVWEYDRLLDQEEVEANRGAEVGGRAVDGVQEIDADARKVAV
ncbi:MAG: 39S ribosomal protein L24, mitochondrial [Peltula sp. TS41687]|nr:MAG: 39S ribosomal protein L24, mitochondrial [Peltula sp. TS41687]